MKALRQFSHNGVTYEAGQPLDQLEVVSADELKVLRENVRAGRGHTQFPVALEEQAPMFHKITQEDFDALYEAGVVGDDDEAVPGPVDSKWLNYQIQEGDQVAEKRRAREQAANRPDNVAENIIPPEPTSSKVVQGDAADAQAAIDKANAEQALAAADKADAAAKSEPTPAPAGE